MEIQSEPLEELGPSEAYSVFVWSCIDNPESRLLSDIGLINKGEKHNYFDYWIVDKKKYFLAKIKYGF